MQIEDDRELVKLSVRYVLEQWIIHRRIVRDSKELLTCMNCSYKGLMNITFIEDGDPLKITYQCRRCHALTEHECVLGKGRVFASRELPARSSKENTPQENFVTLWKRLNRHKYPDQDGYLSLEETYALGCASIKQSGKALSQRCSRRIGIILSRLSQPNRPPHLWATRELWNKLRATSLAPSLDLCHISKNWEANLIMLPQDSFFSPNDGPCSFLAYAWQKRGSYSLFGEQALNLVDKLVVWTYCQKTGATFTAELNLGGRIDQMRLDQLHQPEGGENQIFCMGLMKMALKLSLLTAQHPNLISKGEKLSAGNHYGINWFGLPDQRSLTPIIGAGKCLGVSGEKAIA